MNKYTACFLYNTTLDVAKLRTVLYLGVPHQVKRTTPAFFPHIYVAFVPGMY